MTLALGTSAPDLELRDQHGRRVTLSSFRGRRNVLLVFYPYAFSSVCSNELGLLRDRWPEERDDVELLAISCDPMFTLRAFSDAEGLKFPLLSDFWPHGAVSTAYGVFDERLGCARRSTFLVDRVGTIAWSVHNAMPDSRDIDGYLRALDALAGKTSARLRL